MLQADFVAAVAKKCRERGIDVCIQTACNVPYSEFEKVLPYTDTMMCDFKVFDDTLHQKYVGVTFALWKIYSGWLQKMCG